LYHGSLVARHGLDLAIDVLQIVRKSIPTAIIVICGESTPYIEKILTSLEERGLKQTVRYLGMRNRPQIVEAIEQCDVGIIPNRRSVFTEINMPTRIFEYLALAKPVIAPSTQGIRDYFGTQDIIFFEPDNVADLARKIEYVANHPQEVNATIQRGQAIYQNHLWSKQRSAFLHLVRRLLSGNEKNQDRKPASRPPEMRKPGLDKIRGHSKDNNGFEQPARPGEAVLDSRITRV
jgi:glycosyltransferase involved in cell wall biosynthesis